MTGTQGEGGEQEQIAKRRRTGVVAAASCATRSGIELLLLFAALPKELTLPGGDPISLAVLRFVGSHDVVACCRAALAWWTLEGRRFVLCLDDACRGPGGHFAPLARLAANHVELVRLGRYGRHTLEERAQVIAACGGARILRCTYSKLTGLGAALFGQLELLERRPSSLQLRALRFQGCRLDPADLVALLQCAPLLERADFFGEALAGVGALLRRPPAGGGGCGWPALKVVEFNDCGLGAEDVAALLEVFSSSLASLRVQAASLQGLRAAARLNDLKVLELLDCSLTRADATAVLTQCPHLETLVLCGNPLGEEASCSGSESERPSSQAGASRLPRWPSAPKLQRADLRQCGLDAEDEIELREALSAGPGLELQVLTTLAVGGAGPGGQEGRGRVVFESSSDDEESECSV